MGGKWRQCVRLLGGDGDQDCMQQGGGHQGGWTRGPCPSQALARPHTHVGQLVREVVLGRRHMAHHDVRQDVPRLVHLALAALLVGEPGAGLDLRACDWAGRGATEAMGWTEGRVPFGC